jgi:large subunit ribosomal protein L22
MAEETPEKKPRRRRTKKSDSEGKSPSKPTGASNEGEEATASDASGSEADSPTSEAAAPDEVEPSADDLAAEEATEVVLEADDEAEGESDLETDGEDQTPDAPEPKSKGRRGAGRSSSSSPSPAPTRRRSREKPAGPPPVVRAQAKYVRSSARKARLVCDHIRGKSVEEARAILAITPRAIAQDWSKLLESAVANAEHNHELVGEDLYVKAISADEGPTIRRFRPRAMGRATRIRKRTSHLTISLTPKLREAGGRTKSSKRGAGRPAED